MLHPIRDEDGRRYRRWLKYIYHDAVLQIKHKHAAVQDMMEALKGFKVPIRVDYQTAGGNELV